MKASIFAGMATLVASMAALPMAASAQQTEYHQNAAGQCQGALPVYSTNLRARPTGVNNNGPQSAFISCSSLSNIANTSDIYGVFIINNNTSGSATVNCTLAAGTSFFGVELSPKSQTFSAGGGGFIAWFAGTDYTATDSMNVSCNLPVGVELSFTADVPNNPL